ncbi:hypothetical protein CHUAL_000737 [Chamberlinius hualienensis]
MGLRNSSSTSYMCLRFVVLDVYDPVSSGVIGELSLKIFILMVPSLPDDSGISNPSKTGESCPNISMNKASASSNSLFFFTTTSSLKMVVTFLLYIFYIIVNYSMKYKCQ